MDSVDLDSVDLTPNKRHCGGSGQTGRVGDICALCKGSCVVTQEIKDAYFEKYGRR